MAASVKLAEAFVALTMNLGGLREGLSSAKSEISAGVAGFQSLLGGLGLAGGLGGFYLGAEAAADSALRGIDAQARLAAALKATGGAAGFSAEELASWAGELQDATNIEDETIMESMALLSTFKSVQNDVFKRGTQAALDLAKTGFGSAESQAVALGKALENPTKGITALGRSGVTFTDAEKAKIKELQKSGNLYEAQLVILNAVEGQVKGVAEAMRNTPAGQYEAAKIALGDLQEELGGAVLPSLTRFKQQVVSAAGVGLVFAKGLLAVNDALGGMPGTLAAVSSGVMAVAAALKAARLAGLTFGAAMRTALIGTGVGILLVALGSIASLIWSAIEAAIEFAKTQGEWEGIVAQFSVAWENVVASFDAIWQSLVSIATSALAAIGIDIETTTEDGLSSFGSFVLSAIQWFADLAVNASEWLRVIAENAGTVWEMVKNGLWVALLFMGDLLMNWPGVWSYMSGRVLRFFWDMLMSLIDFLAKALEVMANAVGEFVGWLWDAIKAAITGDAIPDFFASLSSRLMQEAADVGTAFQDGWNKAGMSLTWQPSAAFTNAIKEQERLADKLLDAKAQLEAGRGGRLADLLKGDKKIGNGNADRKVEISAAELKVPSGFIQFDALGKSFQDAMIEKNDPAKQTAKNTDLMRQAAERQEQLLKDIKANTEDEDQVADD
jgi:hypothetical protein